MCCARCSTLYPCQIHPNRQLLCLAFAHTSTPVDPKRVIRVSACAILVLVLIPRSQGDGARKGRSTERTLPVCRCILQPVHQELTRYRYIASFLALLLAPILYLRVRTAILPPLHSLPTPEIPYCHLESAWRYRSPTSATYIPHRRIHLPLSSSPGKHTLATCRPTPQTRRPTRSHPYRPRPTKNDGDDDTTTTTTTYEYNNRLIHISNRRMHPPLPHIYTI